MTLGGTFKPGYESQVVTSGRSHKSGCEPAEGNIHKHGYEATHNTGYVPTTNKIFFTKASYWSCVDAADFGMRLEK